MHTRRHCEVLASVNCHTVVTCAIRLLRCAAHILSNAARVKLGLLASRATVHCANMGKSQYVGQSLGVKVLPHGLEEPETARWIEHARVKGESYWIKCVV